MCFFSKRGKRNNNNVIVTDNRLRANAPRPVREKRAGRGNEITLKDIIFWETIFGDDD